MSNWLGDCLLWKTDLLCNQLFPLGNQILYKYLSHKGFLLRPVAYPYLSKCVFIVVWYKLYIEEEQCESYNHDTSDMVHFSSETIFL